MSVAALLLLAPSLAALAVLGLAPWVQGHDADFAPLLVPLALCQIGTSLWVLQALRRARLAAEASALVSARALAAEAAHQQRRGEVLALLALELRRPLDALRSLLGLMLTSRGLGTPLRPDAAAARLAATDLIVLLDGMRDPQAGFVNDELFRIDELMEQVVALLRGRGAEQGRQLATAVAFGTPAAWVGDPLRLRQILTMLTDNAIDRTRGGSVRIEAREGAAKGLEIAVSDIGMGSIAPEAVDLSPCLALCRDQVARMGGTMRVISAPNHGSQILLALPLHQMPVTEPIAPVTAGEPMPGRAGLPILVVDDVAVNRLLLGAVLERVGQDHAGAASGQEALQMLVQGRYRAVLMDLHMPFMDGFEATRRIRALPGEAGRVPVLAVTAEDSAQSRATAIEAGMNGYLLKPVGLAELEAVLRDLPPQG